MMTTKMVLIVSATLLGLLVAAASMVILIDQFGGSDRAEEESRYSSQEAAAKVREKLAGREYKIRRSYPPEACLRLLPPYTTGKWLPKAEAYLLTFGDVQIKYFEHSDTMLKVGISGSDFLDQCL